MLHHIFSFQRKTDAQLNAFAGNKMVLPSQSRSNIMPLGVGSVSKRRFAKVLCGPSRWSTVLCADATKFHCNLMGRCWKGICRWWCCRSFKVSKVYSDSCWNRRQDCVGQSRLYFRNNRLNVLANVQTLLFWPFHLPASDFMCPVCGRVGLMMCAVCGRVLRRPHFAFHVWSEIILVRLFTCADLFYGFIRGGFMSGLTLHKNSCGLSIQ